MNKDANKGRAEMGDTKSYSAISANGNPLSIRRSGLRLDGTFGLIDALALSYDGNGNLAGIQFANGSATDYVYTATGQKLRAIYHTAMPLSYRRFDYQPRRG